MRGWVSRGDVRDAWCVRVSRDAAWRGVARGEGGRFFADAAAAARSTSGFCAEARANDVSLIIKYTD
jgi:hypothetical protein